MKSKAKRSKPKAKAKKADQSVRLGPRSLTDIWPNERDYMARPDRFKYVRKMIKPAHCVFCEAHERGVSADSLVLEQNDEAMVIMNKYPYNPGHLLILPKRHCGELTELTEQEHRAVYDLLIKATRAVTDVGKCPGFNIGLNHGAVSGAGIPEHLHWHLVPRWFGDTNFFPLIAETKVLPQSLEETYGLLRAHFLGSQESGTKRRK